MNHLCKYSFSFLFLALISSSSAVFAQSTGDPRTPERKIPDVQLSDGQIVNLLKTVDTGEIKIAKAVETRTQNKDVKAFAERMIQDHQKSLTNNEKLAKKIHVPFEPSEQSVALQESVKRDLSSLASAKDPGELDRVYAESQYKAHETALNLLDNSMVTSAKNPELKKELTQVHEVVQKHSDQAEELKKKLASDAKVKK